MTSTNETISETLCAVTIGDPISYMNLAMFPILADAANDPDYLLLDEALAGGCARVTEVSETGSVPELKFDNRCDRPVLLLDGEELVGAKQNRILNVTVLAPANAEIVIPVSCVEAGRWHADSAAFSGSDRVHYAAGRSKKMRSVSAALAADMGHRSDQGEVWEDISAKSDRLASYSESAAAEAMYTTHRQSIDGYLEHCKAVDGQAGALFSINGRVIGLDLFDSPRAFGKLARKLVQSYALDAIDAGGDLATPAGSGDVVRFLDDILDARVDRFSGVGLGEDLRLNGDTITGGALEHAGRVVHLCAFRLQRGPGEDPRNRMSRASARRDRYRG